MSIANPIRVLCLVAWVATASLCTAADSASPIKKSAAIPVAPVHHEGPVDFEKEILPALSTSCLACHNKTKSKAGLVLETPADIRKGGDDGAVVLPGKGVESLMLKAASHAAGIDHPMPPPNNKVAAPDLTSQQLGLLQLWIDQGATGEVKGTSGPLTWQAMPGTLESIYAVAISPDGRFAACGRANRIDVYALPSGSISGSLSDPKLVSISGIAHRDMVESLAFSPDGKMLASGSFREVKLWQRSALGSKIELGDKPATCIATSNDGVMLATGGDDGIIRLWDAETRKSVGDLTGSSSPVKQLSFSPDGTTLASGSQDKTLRLWDIKQRKIFSHAQIPEEIGAMCWTAPGTQIAVGGVEGIIRFWKVPDAAEGEMTLGKAVLQGHRGAVTALATIPNDATHLLSGGEDGTIRRWNITSGSASKQMNHGSPVAAIAVRKDARRFASAGKDGVAKLWNAETVQRVADLSANTVPVANSPSADRALSLAKNEVTYRKNRLDIAERTARGSAERAQKSKDSLPAIERTLAEAQKNFDAMKVANEAVPADAKEDRKATQAKDLTKAETDLKKAQIAKAAAEEEIKLSASALAEANSALAVANSALAQALNRVKNSEAEKTAIKPQENVSLKALHALAFSPDGALLATGGEDGIVRTCSSESGTPAESSGDGQTPLLAVAFAGGGRVVACSTHNAPAIWSPQSTWKLEKTLGSVESSAPLADRVMSLDFSPEGQTLATGGGVPSRSGEIQLFDVATGTLKKSFNSVHSDSVLCVRFNPDGSRLASSSADRFVRVLDLASGKVALSLEGHGNQALGVAWSHDGHTLASVGADNTLRFWDAESGSRGKVIPSFEKEATGVCYVGDADQVVVTSGEGKVRIFRENGSEGRSFPGFSDFVYSVAVSADGSTLIAGGQDGVLRVWDARSGNLTGAFPSPRTQHSN